MHTRLQAPIARSETDRRAGTNLQVSLTAASPRSELPGDAITLEPGFGKPECPAPPLTEPPFAVPLPAPTDAFSLMFETLSPGMILPAPGETPGVGIVDAAVPVLAPAFVDGVGASVPSGTVAVLRSAGPHDEASLLLEVAPSGTSICPGVGGASDVASPAVVFQGDGNQTRKSQLSLQHRIRRTIGTVPEGKAHTLCHNT